MKKLLLLLLLSLGFTSYADTVTYHKSGDYLYGSDGSSCYVDKYSYDVSIVCDNDNNASYGYTSAPMDLGYSSGEAMGTVINDIANAIAEGIANDKSSNTRSYSSGSNNQTSSNPYLPPVIKNSLRNTPFYNVDTTYERYEDAFYGSDGIICTFFNDKEFNCNNGVSYYIGDTKVTKVHGSDGTSYTSNWGNGGNDNYYCVTSSFGSKCCGNWASKSCTKVAKPVPENATAQKEYIQKTEDKPKVADKTTTSSSKSSTNKSDKNNLLDYLSGALVIFLIAWYIFKDGLDIIFPSLKHFSLKRLYKWLTRRR